MIPETDQIVKTFNQLVAEKGGGVIHPPPGSGRYFVASVGNKDYRAATAFEAMKKAVDASKPPEELFWRTIRMWAAFRRDNAPFDRDLMDRWVEVGAPVPRQTHPLALKYLEALAAQPFDTLATEKAFGAWIAAGRKIYVEQK